MDTTFLSLSMLCGVVLRKSSNISLYECRLRESCTFYPYRATKTLCGACPRLVIPLLRKLFSPLLNTRRLFGGERSVTLFTFDLTQETLRVWMRMNQNLYLKTKGGTKAPCIIGVMRILFPIWCKYIKWGYICPRMVISCRLVALSQSSQEAVSFTISERIHAKYGLL